MDNLTLAESAGCYPVAHRIFSLMYSLFKDAARALNWGNTVGADTMSGTGTGSLQTIPVYGRLPASQPAVPGGYVDTIIATVTF